MSKNDKLRLEENLQKMTTKKRLREILKMIDKTTNSDDTVYLGDLYIASLENQSWILLSFSMIIIYQKLNLILILWKKQEVLKQDIRKC